MAEIHSGLARGAYKLVHGSCDQQPGENCGLRQTAKPAVPADHQAAYFEFAAKEAFDNVVCSSEKVQTAQGDPQLRLVILDQMRVLSQTLLPLEQAQEELSAKVARDRARLSSNWMATDLVSMQAANKLFKQVRESEAQLSELKEKIAALQVSHFLSDQPAMRAFFEENKMKLSTTSAKDLDGRLKTALAAAVSDLKASGGKLLGASEIKAARMIRFSANAMSDDLKESFARNQSYRELYSTTVSDEVSRNHLMCELDSNYVKGRDYLDVGFAVGSFALGGVGAALSVGGEMIVSTAVWATRAKAIAKTSAQILAISASSLAGGQMLQSLTDNCLSEKLKGAQCDGSPEGIIKAQNQNHCFLETIFAASSLPILKVARRALRDYRWGESLDAYLARTGKDGLEYNVGALATPMPYPNPGEIRKVQAQTDRAIADLEKNGGVFSRDGFGLKEVKAGSEYLYEAHSKVLATVENSLAKAKSSSRPNQELIASLEQQVQRQRKNVEQARPRTEVREGAASTMADVSFSRRVSTGDPMPAHVQAEMREVATYRVMAAPKASKTSGAKTKFLEHPQFKKDLEELTKHGVEIHIDPTLKLDGGSEFASFNRQTNRISVGPNTPYDVFRHEMQHANFYRLVEPKLARARTVVAEGSSLKSLFRESELAEMAPGQIEKLEAMIKKGHTSRGIDETLATDVQLEMMGYHRYIGNNIKVELYQITEQYTSYLALAKKGPLTTAQLADVAALERRAGLLGLIARPQFEAQALISTLARPTGSLSVSGLNLMTQMRDKMKSEPTPQVIFTEGGEVLIYRNGQFARVRE